MKSDWIDYLGKHTKDLELTKKEFKFFPIENSKGGFIAVNVLNHFYHPLRKAILYCHLSDIHSCKWVSEYWLKLNGKKVSSIYITTPHNGVFEIKRIKK